MPTDDPLDSPLLPPADEPIELPIVDEPTPRRPLTRIDHVLLALEVLIVASALAGGIPAIIDPSGGLHGLAVDLLEGSPFTDFRLPGIALVMLLGFLPFVAIYGTLRRRPWVRAAHLEIAIVLIAWTLIQVWLVGWFTWVQPAFLALGVTIIVLNARNRPPA